MTKKQKTKKPRAQKKVQKNLSPLQSKDIQIEIMQNSKCAKKKPEVKKKYVRKSKVSKLQQFQSQLIPQNNVDQIRLQHISSKIQQNFRTQNQSFLLKIKTQYDQYKQLILKYALIVELTEFVIPKNHLRQEIVNLLLLSIKQAYQIIPRQPTLVISIEQLITDSSKATTLALNNNFVQLLQKTLQSKYRDEAHIKLKIMIQQKQILSQIQTQEEYILKLRQQELVCQSSEDHNPIQLINYEEILQEQQKQEIFANVKPPKSAPPIIQSFFQPQDAKNQFKSLRQFLLKPNVRQQIDLSKISHQSKIQSKQQKQTNNYYTPYQSNWNQNNSQKQMQPYSNQENFDLPFGEQIPNYTPINAKKTMMVSNRAAAKNSFVEGYKEIDKFNYNNKKTLPPQNQNYRDYQPPTDIYQSRVLTVQNRSFEANRQFGQSSLQFSKIYNHQNNNQSNLQISKVQSLHASTIDNDWHSDMSNIISPQNRFVQQQQCQQQYHWIIFFNEISNMRFSRQINIENLKLLCVQIDANFFDDFEYILLSDHFKILIIEQKDLVTAEIHMKLSKGDEKGAIQSLINKIKILMQQFMIQYNSRQVIVLIQYQHKFFLKMLIEYIFPQLGQLQQQYRITPFNQVEELQEIILDLITNQEQVRFDRLIKVPQDQSKFRTKLQNFEFSNLVALRCLNQLYQNLVTQLIS